MDEEMESHGCAASLQTVRGAEVVACCGAAAALWTGSALRMTILYNYSKLLHGDVATCDSSRRLTGCHRAQDTRAPPR